jgi:hypothetical protein
MFLTGVEVQEIVLGGTHIIVGSGELREQADCTASGLSVETEKRVGLDIDRV